MQPALQGKRSDSPGSGNVMDNLLNPKETEADKMLDRIHLMDVNSTNPVHNPDEMAGADRELKPGMSEITRYDKQSKPIPEIEDTLNEFFGIDMESDAGEDIGLEEPSEAEVLQDNTDTDTDTDGVVPFDYEDEIDETPDSSSPVPVSESDDTDLTVLKGLEEAFCEFSADVDQTGRTKILQDLERLGAKWEDEPVKSSLVKIIGLLFDRLSLPEIEQTSVQEGSFRSYDQDPQPGTEPKQESDITDSPSPEPDPQKGVLSKLKRFFRF